MNRHRALAVLLVATLCVSVRLLADDTSNARTADAASTKYYAVTLATSPAPVRASSAPRNLPQYTIYQTQVEVQGKELYQIRVGFFSSSAEAEKFRETQLANYPAAAVTTVTAVERNAALGRNATDSQPKPPSRPEKPTPAVPARVAETQYAVELDILPQSSTRASSVAGIPQGLQGQTLYRVVRMNDGNPMFHLRLGFFRTQAEADNAQRQLVANFSHATVVRVTPEEIQQSEAHTVSMDTTTVITPVPPREPVPASPATSTASTPTAPATAAAAIPVKPPAPTMPTTATAAPTTTAATADIERRALTLMSQGREALTRADNPGAVRAFGELLLLPPNSQTRDAQELIGLARERAGEIAKAKAEYELYLRLYPDGENADRVRQRLGVLTAGDAQESLKQVKRKEFSEKLLVGSISQYYYRGNSKIETQTTTANTLDTQNLSLNDQNALVTTVDAMARYRDNEQDNRIVFRDTLTNNFLQNIDDQNKLRAAYYEHRNKIKDWSVRLGRQPGSAGGVLGKFDGVLGSYGIDPKWHLGIVAGNPVDNPIDSSRHFLGTSLDMGTFAEHWNGSLYLFKQTVDGITDRQAIGSELRYFDPRGSVFSLIDYDTSFAVLNTALVQANWQTDSKINYNLLFDRRKSPALQTTNALMGETSTSISALLQRMSESEIRRRALAVTSTSTLSSVGVMAPVSAKWQLGGDVKMSRISATEGTDVMPATPDTGNVLTYTAQTIGTGLFSQRDISVFSVSYITGDTYDGESLAATNRALSGPWSLDSSIRWYQQKDTLGTTLSRLSPTLRLGYRWRENLTIEFEIGIEDSKTDSATTQEDSRRNFFSLGYRWDF